MVPTLSRKRGANGVASTPRAAHCSGDETRAPPRTGVQSRPVVFSLDPGALHRPLGVAFGARGAAAAEPAASGWIGVELPVHRAVDLTGAPIRGAPLALVLPRAELCGAAGAFSRGQLARS